MIEAHLIISTACLSARKAADVKGIGAEAESAQGFCWVCGIISAGLSSFRWRRAILIFTASGVDYAYLRGRSDSRFYASAVFYFENFMLKI